MVEPKVREDMIERGKRGERRRGRGGEGEKIIQSKEQGEERMINKVCKCKWGEV